MAPDHLLSPNFTLAEMTRSQTAVRLQLDNDVAFDSPEYQALQDLCENILEPIREALGPIHINSGFRSPAVNEAIGGVATSQHCLGQAADFRIPGKSVLEVTQWIAASDLPWDQLIYEFGELGWTHCSFGPRNRREVLTARHATPTYVPGIQV